ncbi:helix-turn-helix transcriptional regulator [Sphingomonas oligophenolica]
MIETSLSANPASPRAAPVVAVPGEQAFALARRAPDGVAGRAGFPVAPHVHPDMLQIILAMSGNCCFTIDGERHQVEAPCLITVPGGGVHGFEVGPAVRGWAVTIAHQRVLDLVVNRGLDIGFLLRRSYIAGFGTNRRCLHDLAIALRNLCGESGGGLDGEAVCVEALQRIVLVHVLRTIRQGQEPGGSKDNRDRDLFLEFRAMVERIFLTERGMARYVAALRCSHVRLNRACMRFAGLSAKGVILDRLADEARRRLIYTTSSATQIGYALGFAEPSYFVRFFRRHTGMTPGQFRKANTSGR